MQCGSQVINVRSRPIEHVLFRLGSNLCGGTSLFQVPRQLLQHQITNPKITVRAAAEQCVLLLNSACCC